MGRVGGDAYCEYNTVTATPWMSLMKATCRMSSLLARNTAVWGATRKLPDHLNATHPGGHRTCPPMGVATHVVDVEWKMLRNDLSKGGMRHAWTVVASYGQRDVRA
eukprot:5743763-Pyramimonas_sp.AAC.1